MTQEQAVKKVLSIAIAELGYKEKASNAMLDSKTLNAGSGNYTKYARDIDAISGYYNGKKQGYSWCDVFVDWCFWKAFSYPTGREMLYQPERSLGAGTGYSAGYYKRAGAWFTKPEKGDQIFFQDKGGICHTGIVEKVEGGAVCTIEGNALNMVSRHIYNLGASNIAGYGRPNWSLVANDPATKPEPEPKPEPTKEVEVKIEELRFGSAGTPVKSMQILLIGYGCSCGKWGADGDFGAATKSALMAFQQKKGLTVDGICGAKTWNALING